MHEGIKLKRFNATRRRCIKNIVTRYSERLKSAGSTVRCILRSSVTQAGSSEGRQGRKRSDRKRGARREGWRGCEKATRNQRGVEFRGYRKERGRKREKERAGERRFGKKGARGSTTGGNRGVTAILYLARHDRVNELSLRGGPTGGDTLFPLVLPRPPANYDPTPGEIVAFRRRAAIIARCSLDRRSHFANSRIVIRAKSLLLPVIRQYRLMAAQILIVTPDGLARAKKKRNRGGHDLQRYFCNGDPPERARVYLPFFFSMRKTNVPLFLRDKKVADGG